MRLLWMLFVLLALGSSESRAEGETKPPSCADKTVLVTGSIGIWSESGTSGIWDIHFRDLEPESGTAGIWDIHFAKHRS